MHSLKMQLYSILLLVKVSERVGVASGTGKLTHQSKQCLVWHFLGDIEGLQSTFFVDVCIYVQKKLILVLEVGSKLS